MNWLKKIFSKKKNEPVKVTPNRPYLQDLEHLRKQTDREFFDLYFNHPPIESSIPIVDNSQIWYDTGQPEITPYDSFGHGGSFSGGGASASWDDNNSSDISSWSDSSSSSDSGSYDSGSSDSSSGDW